jgi:hypothetical protein
MAMPLTLITGPANSGKARAVLDEVHAHAARGAEPLLVLPTHDDVGRYRRELADAGLVMGVRVERFRGLLAEISRRAQAGAGAGGDAFKRPLSPLQREQLLRNLLPSVRSGHVRAVAELVGELQVERVSPQRFSEALIKWAAAGGTARAARARQLDALFAGYHELLALLGRSDPDWCAVQALDRLRRKPALWGRTPVLLYGFDDLTRLQLDAIETLARIVDTPVTLSLSYEPGRVAFAERADAFQTLQPWAARHQRLEARADYYAPCARATLHHLERGLFATEQVEAAGCVGGTVRADEAVCADEGVCAGEGVCADGVVHADAVRLLEGSSPRAELELVAAQIQALLAAGMAPAEIVITHRAPAAIAELLAEVLAASAIPIPFACTRRLRFDHTALGRALCGLLAAACGGQPDCPAEGGLEDLLAWLRAPGPIERPELVDRLEASARRRGISEAAPARSLWEAEHWPLAELDAVLAAARRGPLALIERTLQELRRLFSAPRRRQAQVLADTPDLEEAAALTCAVGALEELAELARAAPELAPDPAGLIAILRELECDLETGQGDAQAPAPGGTQAVTLLHPLALRARRVRALFLCGLQAGVFPAAPKPQPVFSEEERRGLAELAGLRLSTPRQALAAERYLLYAAVSRPEQQLVLSWHAAGEDGQPAIPSLFIDDICDLFPAQLRDTRLRRAEGVAAWPGDAVSESPALHVSELPALNASESSALHVLEPPALQPLRDERLLAELRAERLWSASALETYAGCPARWLVERLLRAQPLDPDPEPLARGGLAHAALRDTFAGLRARFGSAQLTPARLAAARELLHQALARHAGDFPLSVLPERVPGVRRRLEADLERYLQYAAQLDSEPALEPTHLELSFGFADEQPALPPLQLGEDVRVRGRIDRIDIAPAGQAVLYDYKGAYAAPADRWLADGNLQLAIYMRAAEQLLHCDVAGGFYQPLSGRDLRARGVLSEDAGIELACVGGDKRERADMQSLLRDTLALARSAAHKADAGALSAQPDTCAFGDGGCLYPSICRCER